MGRRRLSHGPGRNVYRKAMGRCAHCGCKTYLPKVDENHALLNQGPRMATLDHVVPVAKGGRNAVWNLQLLCFACNQAKEDKLPQEKINAASNR